MNKKFLAVIGSAAVATAFWACGSGDIYEPTDNDLIFKEVMEQPGAVKSYCSDGMGCEGAFAVESSSSEEEDIFSSSSFPGNISSEKIDIGSSSSVIEIIPSIESSSSATLVTGLGSCAPIASPVDKNVAGAAQFKFVPNTTTSGYNATAFANATYDWNYGPNSSEPSGTAKNTSDKVTYSASGAVTASVTVTMKDGSSELITCKELQVNGDPITGCTCTTEAKSVDYTETPDVTWSVTGCKSTSAITSYAWAGGAAGASTSYTKTFTAATASFAPTLKVGNSDKTVIDVTCPAIKVTKGAEYSFTEKGTEGAINFTSNIEANVVFDLPTNWHNDNNAGTCSFVCTVTRGDGGDGKITGSIGETAIAGGDYVATTISTAITVGKTSVPFVLKLGSNTGASCRLEW